MGNNIHLSRMPQSALCAFAAAMLFAAGPANVRADVSIANSPLFLTSSVDPNILFILDDSGSMFFEVTPDEIAKPTTANTYGGYAFPRASNVYGTSDYAVNFIMAATVDDGVAYTALTRSPQVNATYYDPSITYVPWTRYDNTLYPAASTTCAWHNPEKTGTCPADSVNAYARNLTVNNGNYNSNYWYSCSKSGDTITCSSTNASKTFWPATYYWHDGGDIWTWGNYTKVEIRSTTTTYTGHGRANRTDCVEVEGQCSYEEELQNFANWYTYYRSRILASRAGIGRAFAQQGENMRVGYGAINKGSSTVDNVSTSTIVRGVRQFDATGRESFFNELYTRNIPATGTPLRKALDDAGQYFSRTDSRGPWSTTPGASGGTDLECRQSFTILMTDGYWSSGTDFQASTAAARGHVDNLDGPEITAPDGTTYQYTPADPYRDTQNNTLADIAMYYWNRDLRPDIDNLVPTTPENEAFWQHMVTFGVGLGVVGSVEPDDAWAAVASASPIAWPDTASASTTNCSGATCLARLDDLLHAAINSRGGFFSAADPNTFATKLAETLDAIVARVEASGTAAATSSAVLQTETLLYTASFRSTDWSGSLVARSVNPDGTAGTEQWNAETILAAADSATLIARKMYTSDGSGTPVALDFDEFGADQKTALNRDTSGTVDSLGSERIDWLRGFEHPELRDREVSGTVRRIGDLVSSDPQFMFRRDYGNSLLADVEGSSYKTFRASSGYQDRVDVLFVGSNDGMLHAFHAGTPFIDDPDDPDTPPAKIMNPDGGKELFAYMPSELLLPGSSGTHARIVELMDPEYDHRWFVDGTPAVADVYWGSETWKTVVVGTMGAGGRTVFGLDVTDPESFDESKVLWEFGYADADCTVGVTACREIGYGISQPTIARLSNGTWVAIFGNGYNSASHTAKLFVVNIKTGQLVHLLDTGVGTSANPNGLSAPVATDWPSGNLSVTRVYAGDLHGNVWRFNLNSTPSFSALFSATDGDGVAQPITARPSVALMPGDPQQVVVLFGTGSYFRLGDADMSSPQVQTLYGIFDSTSGVSGTVRGDLREQTISTNATAVTIGTRTYPAGSLRFISNNPIESGDKGWRIDLPASGERVISEATFPSGAVQSRVRFTTLIPDDDPCGSGRQGFLLDVDLLSGGRFVLSVFDLSGDGLVDTGDLIDGVPVSGILGTTGERITVIRKPDAALDFLYAGDGEKVIDGANVSGPVGRQSWRQLR